MRRLAAFVLVFEALVACFFGLVAMKLSGVGAGTVWAVVGPFAVLCVALAGMLRRRWAYAVGWLLQVLLVASGAWVTMMFFLGWVFALIWWQSLRIGARIDALKAARAALEAAADEGAAASKA